MGIFKWRGRIARADFRRRFIDAVLAAAPALQCTAGPDDDLDVRIEGAGEFTDVRVSLERAYAEFEKDPGDCEEILARWVRSIDHLWLPPAPLDLKNIVPMIKDRSWLAVQAGPGEDSFWADDYNEELVVVYAEHHKRFSYPPRSYFLAAGVRPEQIRELALQNLRERTPDREIGAINGAWMITAGGNFEASLLLDEDLWNDPKFSESGTLLVSVPERDGIFACTDDSVAAVWNLAIMASHGVRTQPYPITSRLFVRTGTHFELLDLEDDDDEHPIPSLGVVDISMRAKDGTARYVIVVATPLAKDPRSVFRLFRKLDGYLGLIDGKKEPGPMSEIEINIHRGSDPAIFALLAVLPAYVSSRGARLIVERSE
jgi:hypothetical protein